MEKGDPKMPINVDQAVIASVMATRVVRGNATDSALRSLESEVAEHRSN